MAGVAERYTPKGRVLLCLTGFGKFHGVEDNPTTALIEDIQARVAQDSGSLPEYVHLASAEVLHVSRGGVKEGLKSVAKHLKAQWQSSDRAVLVHFGVYDGYPNFRLECTGKNCAQWMFSDESGETQMFPAPVVPSAPDTLQVKVDAKLAAACVRADERAGSSREKIECTDDAGLFICNYMLYSSLHLTSSSTCSASYFVHVPAHRDVPREEQLKVAMSIIRSVCAYVQDGTAGVGPSDAPPAWASLSAAAGELTVPAAKEEEETKAGASDAAESSHDAENLALEAALDGVLADLAGSGEGDAAGSSASEGQGTGGSESSGAGASGGEELDAQVAASLHMALRGVLGGGGGTGADEAGSGGFERRKMVIVARDDLGMSAGKLAAQCCHAALAGFREAQEKTPGELAEWVGSGEKIVVVKAKDEGDIRRVQTAARERGLLANGITDAGRTEVAPGTRTVLAVGPAKESKVDAVTGSLRLL